MWAISWRLRDGLPEAIFNLAAGSSVHDWVLPHVLLDGRYLTLDVHEVVSDSEIKHCLIADILLRGVLKLFFIEWIKRVDLQGDYHVWLVANNSDPFDLACADVLTTTACMFDCNAENHMVSYVLLQSLRDIERQT